MSSLGSKITGLYYWIDHTTVVLVTLATQNERCQVKSVVNVAKYKAAVVCYPFRSQLCSDSVARPLSAPLLVASSTKTGVTSCWIANLRPMLHFDFIIVIGDVISLVAIAERP